MYVTVKVPDSYTKGGKNEIQKGNYEAFSHYGTGVCLQY